MPTYYVGPGGADVNNGLTWGTRKLTLNGAEDVPVVAGDTVYVGPGVYRELLTVDVSGGAGNPITYIGDVTGEHTDGVGGIVRTTGSDNDQTTARSYCVDSNGKNYRTFRGFCMDTASTYIIRARGSPTNWIIEDCWLSGCTADVISIEGDNQEACTIRRCLLPCIDASEFGVNFTSAGTQDGDHLVENCIFSGAQGGGIGFDDVGGTVVKNCLFSSLGTGVWITDALPVGHTVNTVNNCIFIGINLGMRSVNLGELVEDYNTFYLVKTPRNTVNVGANSETYPPLLQPPILHAGASQASGYRLPWWFGELSEWSQVRAIAGTGEPAVDLFGIERPYPSNRKSWGPVQHMDAERETGTVHAGSAAIALHRPARKQIFVPSTATSTTVTVWVYREAGYLSDRNPGMIIKQPGVADRVTRDAGLAAQWNQITDTFVPAASPPWFAVELANENYYSTTTSTSTTTTSTSTTVTLPTTSTSTTTTSLSTSTSTTTLDVFFDDLVVS